MREVIWSIDPFQKDNRVWKNSIELLKFFAEPLEARTTPVYVSSPLEVRLATAGKYPKVGRLSMVARLVAQKALRGAGIQGLEKPHIIVQPEGFSVTLAAKALSNYAQKSLAEFILVGTHSRSGIGRFFLGSFAETLLYHAKSPVLLVGKKVRRANAIRKIHFATDLSAESRTAFRRICRLAHLIRAEVQIHHVVVDTSSWGNPFDGLVLGQEAFLLQSAIKAQMVSSKRQLSSFIAIAKKHRVRTKTIVTKTPFSAGSEVLKQAQRSKADLVAVATQSGPIRAALGSVAREVVRKSPIPVWICPRLA